MKDMGCCHGAVKKGKGQAKLGVIGHGKGTGTVHPGMGRKEGLVMSGVCKSRSGMGSGSGSGSGKKY